MGKDKSKKQKVLSSTSSPLPVKAESSKNGSNDIDELFNDMKKKREIEKDTKMEEKKEKKVKKQKEKETPSESGTYGVIKSQVHIVTTIISPEAPVHRYRAYSVQSVYRVSRIHERY